MLYLLTQFLLLSKEVSDANFDNFVSSVKISALKIMIARGILLQCDLSLSLNLKLPFLIL